MKDIERLKLVIQAAQMYYDLGQTQREIADKLGISRPTVSRLLAEGRDMGIVQITINNPLGYCSKLEEIFREEFNLKEVIIVPRIGESLIQTLAEVGGNYLHRILKDGDTIGLSWGNTLQHLASKLPSKKLNNIRVVQMKGGMGISGTNVHASQIVELFSSAFWGRASYLPVPAIVDTVNVKRAFLSDSSLKRTMQVWEEINVAIFSIGAPNQSAAQVQAGYLTPQEIQSLQSKGAVGDICSRFFNIDGQITDTNLDQRTIGIELAELCDKEYAIALTLGKEKAPGILGALRGGFMNVLITDEETAVLVLEMAGIKQEY